jgi:DNA-binding NtrC family response regulator
MARLLIVDDDKDVAALLADELYARGHDVRLGHDGAEGLRLVAEERPDVVLLDVEMPVLSGPQMAALMALRDRGDESVPIILLSGVVDFGRVVAQVGTPYFLQKPYTMESLVALVERALAERTPPHVVLA